VGHKIADSLAPGIDLMIGTYEMNVFAEASAASPGFMEVDFIRGHTAGTPASESLRAVSALYSHKGLPNLCAKHSVNFSQVNDFGTLLR
jgi:hypothetical protein